MPVTALRAEAAPAVDTSAAASAADAPAADSAAASTEAARVKELEAQLAEFKAQKSQLQAQNLRLTSELELAQHLSQEGSRMASLVRPPPYWQAHPQGQTLVYVELPIPEINMQAGGGVCSDAELRLEHKKWINEMRTNGIDKEEALAALR